MQNIKIFHHVCYINLYGIVHVLLAAVISGEFSNFHTIRIMHSITWN